MPTPAQILTLPILPVSGAVLDGLVWRHRLMSMETRKALIIVRDAYHL